MLSTGVGAQTLNYSARGFSASTGTYTDLGSTGVAIATANTDDANSAPQEIGFTFRYNGQEFTQFVLNTNGFVRLGTSAPAAMVAEAPASLAGSPALSTNAADVNLLMPFAHDLVASTAQPAEYRVATTGTAPNRVCTIQWKNVADKAAGTAVTQFDPLNFQLQLHEQSGIIAFVYGSFTATAAPALKAAGVGLKGSGTEPGQLTVLTKTPSNAWSVAKAQDKAYSGTSFFVRRPTVPASGLTYQFAPIPERDATVSTMYTLGQLPIGSATPHVLTAKVANVGLNSLTGVQVTLQVSGATEFTSTKTIDLAAQDTVLVTFDAYTPTVAGTNQVQVRVADDDNNANNALGLTQQVTTNLLGYADDAPLISGPTFADERLLLARYRLTRAQAVQAVNVLVPTTATNEGQTVYAVVLDAGGALVGRSLNYVVRPVDLGRELSLTLLSPIKAEAEVDFYVGLAQTLRTNTQVGTTAYNVVGLQAEKPVRPDSAYFMAPLEGGMPHSYRGGRFAITAQLTDVPACLAPGQLTATNTTATSTTLTFKPVEGASSYVIEYGPYGFLPGSAGATAIQNVPGGSPYQLTGLSSGQRYDVYLRSTCASGSSGYVGPVTIQTACATPTPALAGRIRLDFDNVKAGDLPCNVTVLNSNDDPQTWQTVVDYKADFSNAIRLFADYDTGKAADDWFFVGPIQADGGLDHNLTFRYRAESEALAEGLEVTVGAAATPEAQTTLLWKKTDITNTDYANPDETLLWKPATTGEYYLGFHGISEKERSYLFVDDIRLESIVTSVQKSLSSHLHLYPNPVANQLWLDLRGTNARGPLQVEILNMLGKRVYAGQAEATSPTALDVSRLAAGHYVLRVQAGNQVGVRPFQVQR
ncbi:T9SS type A sorting domain-containing protein [Hymenobacter lutimineralis]|nr:T9SS type A sorting domain-containing protein [Hymenobacter lutimineralis]